MNIYVAGHEQLACRYVASRLKQDGFQVTSTWLEKPFCSTDTKVILEPGYTQDEVADRDAFEVLNSNGLVLVNIGEAGPGGKFIETGIAIGTGKRVFLLGERTNLLLFHPLVSAYPDIDHLCRGLMSARHDTQM
jgi:hypothetical protein